MWFCVIFVCYVPLFISNFKCFVVQVCYVVWVLGELFMCFIVVLGFVGFYLVWDEAGRPSPF